MTTSFPLSSGSVPSFFASCDQYLALMPVWSQVADILKTKPPGTLARIEGEWLVMAPMDDQLVMFCSPDLSGPDAGNECYLYRPEDHDFDDPDDFNATGEALTQWLENPVFEPAGATPDQVKQVVRLNYALTNNVDQAANWAWDGSSL